MIPHLDVEGRMTSDPDLFKGKVAPRLKHITTKIIQAALIDMASHKLIVLYSVDGDQYLSLRNFHKHNNVRLDREGKSTLPAPPDSPEDSGSSPGVVQQTNEPLTGELPHKLSEDKSREDNICTLAIEYLNNKIKTSYNPQTKKTKEHIIARVREGFCIEDFEAVIDSRVSLWGEDNKMKEYLRPETLFGSKFESYLQMAKRGYGKKQAPSFRTMTAEEIHGD
jgi:uncharacterized phage protein (TIGR02220 family)